MLAENPQRLVTSSNSQNKSKCLSYVLDGDILRKGLNVDLDLSPEGRKENIRRAFEVANILADANIITICAFISPYQKIRKEIKNKAKVTFYEVFSLIW